MLAGKQSIGERHDGDDRASGHVGEGAGRALQGSRSDRSSARRHRAALAPLAPDCGRLGAHPLADLRPIHDRPPRAARPLPAGGHRKPEPDDALADRRPAERLRTRASLPGPGRPARGARRGDGDGTADARAYPPRAHARPGGARRVARASASARLSGRRSRCSRSLPRGCRGFARDEAPGRGPGHVRRSRRAELQALPARPVGLARRHLDADGGAGLAGAVSLTGSATEAGRDRRAADAPGAAARPLRRRRR